MKHKRRACGDVRRARVQNTTDSADSRGRQKKCIVLITSKRVMLITSPHRLPYMETFFLALLSIFKLRRTTTRPACDKVVRVEISGVHSDAYSRYVDCRVTDPGHQQIRSSAARVLRTNM